ncbi:MAG: LPS-assembly protein LptD, partial [Hyphomicrobiaceae bacterium]
NILQTDRVNTVYMRGLSDRNYFSIAGYHFGGLLLTDTPQSESRVHPIIDWRYIAGQPVLGGELSWNVNALSFSRTDAIDNRKTTDINRAIADVSWRRKLTDRIGITYTPFADLRGDIYQFRDVVDPVTGATIESTTVTRGVASAGMLAAYPWIASSAGATHVIEPVGQIIGRTARVNQRHLPDEDAKSLVFDDTNLFDLDKMSGYDRIETGTRANIGLQYTFQANGGAHARLLAGQSFHLSGDNIFRNPGLDADGKFIYTPRSGLETDRSDYVAGLYLAPNNNLRAVGQLRLDEQDLSIRRADIYAGANFGLLTGSAIYSFTASDPTLLIPQNQQDIYALLGLKLSDRWSAAASVRYDIDAGTRLQDAFQLRYADECFVLTATYTETFINDPSRDIVPDRSVMLRFELKHLGEFRYKTDALDHVFGENQPPR